MLNVIYKLLGGFAFVLLYCLIALPVSSQPQLTNDFLQQQVAGYLRSPWAAVNTPDGGWLITEREGAIVVVDPEGLKQRILPVLPDLYVKGQGGLMDIALLDSFAQDKGVLLTYSTGTDEANTLQVAITHLVEEEPDVTPVFTLTPSRSTPVHYGGRLARLADGSWLLSSGDGFDYREQAQVASSQLGKTLRFNLDGSAPKDNPFAGGDSRDNYVFSLGHRNPQGLIADEQHSRILLLEHGPAGGDEVNLIEPGKNYGWPVVTLGKDYSGANISPFTSYPGMIDPVYNWTPSIAPSSMALYQGDAFLGLQGHLLVASLKNKALFALALDQNPIPATQIFATIDERLRDVIVDSEGVIYVLTDGERARLLKFIPIRQRDGDAP